MEAEMRKQGKNPADYQTILNIDKMATDSSYITDSDDSMKDPDEEAGEV